MQLTGDFSTVRFALGDDPDLAPGDLFVMCSHTGEIVRGIRAVIPGQDDDPPTPCFVTVGPFGAEGAGKPMVGYPVQGDPTPVAKLNGVSFRPSLLPEHVRRRDRLSAHELTGCVLLMVGATYLCVPDPATPHSPSYLDLDSGELLPKVPEGGLLITTAWDLVVQYPGTSPEALFSYPEERIIIRPECENAVAEFTGFKFKQERSGTPRHEA